MRKTDAHATAVPVVPRTQYLNAVLFSLHGRGLDPFARTLFRQEESIPEGVLTGLEVTGILHPADTQNSDRQRSTQAR